MSDMMFPVFKDESGWTAPVARQNTDAVATDAGSGSFRELVTAQESTTQLPAAEPAATMSKPQQQTYVFKDEGAAFDTSTGTTATGEKQGGVTLFAEGNEPTLWDLLDFVNPLQHIPVVNTLYREVTGDKIGALAKLTGSAVVGGPVGVGIAMASLTVEDATGKDIGEHVLALFKDDAAPDAGQTQYAQATTAETPAVQPQPQAEVEPAKTATAATAETPAAPPQAEVKAQAEPAKTTTEAAGQSAQPVAARFRPVPPRGALAVPTAVKPPSGPKISSTATPAPVRSVPAPVATTTTSSASGTPDEQSNEWFVNRFTDAMNKYDQAHKLAPRSGQAL